MRQGLYYNTAVLIYGCPKHSIYIYIFPLATLMSSFALVMIQVKSTITFTYPVLVLMWTMSGE